MRKTLFVTAAIALLASPAVAQSPYGSTKQLYGYAGPGSTIVVADGRVIGMDPDPNVRLEILRSSQTSDLYSY